MFKYCRTINPSALSVSIIMDEQTYLRKLKDIGQELNGEVEVLRFLIDKYEITRGIEFIHHLFDQKLISVDDNTFLKDCLESVERNDLVTAYFRGDPPKLIDGRWIFHHEF